jgi:hypothetical protein
VNHTTKLTVSVFGAVVALAALEHGVGAVLQGNVAPEGIVFESWAGSELFRILAGEPAMTLIPNLLISGILTILLALLFFAWATIFARRKRSGLVLIGLSLLLLLVGGGFGPPLVGLIVASAATRIHAPLTWWRRHLSAGGLRILGTLWPWFLGCGLCAWLFLIPGVILLDAWIDLNEGLLFVPVITFAALALLLLSFVAAFARDLASGAEIEQMPSFSN